MRIRMTIDITNQVLIVVPHLLVEWSIHHLRGWTLRIESCTREISTAPSVIDFTSWLLLIEHNVAHERWANAGENISLRSLGPPKLTTDLMVINTQVVHTVKGARDGRGRCSHGTSNTRPGLPLLIWAATPTTEHK